MTPERVFDRSLNLYDNDHLRVPTGTDVQIAEQRLPERLVKLLFLQAGAARAAKPPAAARWHA